MFSSLAVDISLHIISFLPPHSIYILYTLSRQTNQFITANESAIFHQLTVSHRIVSAGTSLEDAIEYKSRYGPWMEGVQDWKQLFRRWFIVERNWRACGSIIEGGRRSSSEIGRNVRRFQVDESSQTIIQSDAFTLLSVYSIETSQKLWSIPEVRRFEWSEGFLTFPGRNIPGIEIWRRYSDILVKDAHNSVITPLLPPSPLAVTDVQLKEGELYQSLFRNTHLPESDRYRGHYVPHGFIRLPPHFHVRLLRLHFPVLAAIWREDPYTVHLYDVAQGIYIRAISIERIRTEGTWSSGGFAFPVNSALMDMHVSQHYVSVCFDSAAVLIAHRQEDEVAFPTLIITEPDPPRVIQQLAPQLQKVPHEANANAERFAIQKHQDHFLMPGAAAVERYKVVPPSSEMLSGTTQALVAHDLQSWVSSYFVTAKVSPDGRHLVVASGFGILYLFPDFCRIAGTSATLREAIQRIHIGETLTDVIWDTQPRRFALRTEIGQTYIVELDPLYHSFDVYSEGGISLEKALIHRLTDFRAGRLRMDGQMQMTRTRLWLVWDPELLHKVVLARAQAREQGGRFSPDEEQNVEELLEFNPRNYTSSLCLVDFQHGIRT